MTFISLQFLIFFLIVTSLYFVVPHRWRWLLLLVAGCIFYMSFIPVYILLLFLLIIIDYSAGLLIERTKKKGRAIFLIISIMSTIAVLFVFKYFNFFIVNFAQVLIFINWNYSEKFLSLALPIGLSFHTFQSLSYVIEVYRGRQKAEHHLGIYALYVMFYPQLMAGPIERPYNMLHQFHEKHNFEYKSAVRGLRLMLWGAFQKVVVADRAAVVVNLVYGNPTAYSGLVLIIATVLFAFQIFCDFAGYSNIAIGAARVMGFRLMKNFDGPYFATSIGEFWSKWHISLSTWFRDYLYIPLGGSRVSKLRYAFNIMATFLVSGLWHGANWTFVVWGGLHGFFLLVSKWTSKYTNKLGSLIQWGITFSLVTYAWIFFRAKDLTEALYISNHLFINLTEDLLKLAKVDLATIETLAVEKEKILGLTPGTWFVVIAAILTMTIVRAIQNRKSMHDFLEKLPLPLRWAIYYALILIIVFYTARSREQFIYFQF